jgi:hypothetical protein
MSDEAKKPTTTDDAFMAAFGMKAPADATTIKPKPQTPEEERDGAAVGHSARANGLNEEKCSTF